MASDQKIPGYKKSVNEVIENFRSKDDRELGEYSKSADSHRKQLEKELKKQQEKEEKRRQKEAKNAEKQRKEDEKRAKNEAEKMKKEKSAKPSMSEEELYNEVYDNANYEEDDMPSNEIKGKIFSDYKPLSSAPAPGKKMSEKEIGQSMPEKPKKPNFSDLIKGFETKFSDKPAEQSSQEANKKIKTASGKNSDRKTVATATKKLLRKKSEHNNSPADSRQVYHSQHIYQTPKSIKAPPMPPQKNFNPKYIKEDYNKEDYKESYKSQKETRENHPNEHSNKEFVDYPHQQVPVSSHHDNAVQHIHQKQRSAFVTGLLVSAGIFTFFFIVGLLLFGAILLIDYITGSPIIENGALVLP